MTQGFGVGAFPQGSMPGATLFFGTFFSAISVASFRLGDAYTDQYGEWV
jgi:hypothetical protein